MSKLRCVPKRSRRNDVDEHPHANPLQLNRSALLRSSRQLANSRDLPEKVSLRLRRAPQHRGAGRYIRNHAGLGTDLGSAPDPQMPRHGGLAADADKILQHRRARNAHLGDNDATAAEHNIVADLHQIIEPRARTDNGILRRSPIDRGVGPNLHVVFQNDPSKLWHRQRIPTRRRQNQILPARSARRGKYRRDPQAGRGSDSRGRQSGSLDPPPHRFRSPHRGRRGSPDQCGRRSRSHTRVRFPPTDRRWHPHPRPPTGGRRERSAVPDGTAPQPAPTRHRAPW